MAIGVKEWIGLAVAGLVIVAVWALPASHLDLRGRAVLPEVARYEALRGEQRTNAGLLLASRWSDSLSELAVRTAVEGVAAGVPMDDVTPERYEEWVEELRAMSRSLEPRDPEMVLGIFHVTALHGAPEIPVASSSTAGGTYVGVRDGVPYCLLVQPWEAFDDGDLRLPGTLEACRFFVQYGQAGARVGSWLASGGIRFAAGSHRLVRPPDSRGPSRAWWEQVDAPVFGVNRFPPAITFPPGGRCLAGDTGACVEVVTGAGRLPTGWQSAADLNVTRYSPLTHTSRLGASRAFTSAEPYLLLDLELQFGPAAFARFWTSDVEVTEAFADAFDTDLGSWTSERLRSDVGSYWAGPAVEAGTLLYVLLTIMGLAAFVSYRARRRTVG